MASASRALRMLIDTALVFEGRSFVGTVLRHFDFLPLPEAGAGQVPVYRLASKIGPKMI